MTQLLFNPDGTIKVPESLKESVPNYEKVVNDFKKKNVSLNNFDKSNNEDDLDEEESDELVDNSFMGEEELGFDDKKYNENENVEGFNLYENGVKLTPLIFSNGKTQDGIVDEIYNEIKGGKKVIFVRGVCGSGKSGIALNLAKKIGRASIVVPGKALQRQYKEDYSKNKYVLKEDHTRLKIKVITGRDNHKCLFSKNCSADNHELPCKIEIREKNIDKIREYLKENNRVKDDLELKNIRRISVAPVCPYWSPIIPSEYDFPLGGKKVKYMGLKGIEFTIFNRKEGCKYYNQFNSYIDGEAIVFNSAKYNLEVAMNRKPETDVEIIDECDEFLDSFSNVSRINLTRLMGSLMNIFFDEPDLNFINRNLIDMTRSILADDEVQRLALKDEIVKLKETKIYDILSYILENSSYMQSVDEESYCAAVIEIAMQFEDMFDDSYVSFSVEEKGIYANIASVNLAKKFAELNEKTKALVFMSGTIHAERVLRDVFGIKDFVSIDAETVNLGKIETLKTNFEMDCRYENFLNGNISRESYLIALDKAVEKAPRPTLIHVNSFSDLPSLQEKEFYHLNGLISREKFIELQQEDKENRIVEKFKKKQTDVLFTTKCSRGVDFPGDQCRSIIFTKYPNPNVNSIFWKVLRKTRPAYYWEFYKDKAKREFLQKIYRGVRSKEDFVYILSPDSRVLDEAMKI